MMPINARDCYENFSEIECDGVPSNALNFLDIVETTPYAFELGKGKSLGLFGSRTNHDHSQMRTQDGREQSEPPKPDATTPPKFPPTELPIPKLQLENRLDQFPTRLGQIQLDPQVDDLVQKLPDHPIREVARSLLKGLLTGEINREEVARAMAAFTRAYNSKDITNLPPVNSDDFPLGDTSEISLRLRKASIKFNDALLTKLGLKMEVIDEKGIVIRNRKDPPTNIAVRMSGEIDTFQGRLERKEYKALTMQDAVAALQP